MVYQNLNIIETADKSKIVRSINPDTIALHFTNGTYVAGAELIVPTTLAGFQYVAEDVAQPWDSFVIAVNSDVSMGLIGGADEDQMTRAKKVAEPLAACHPDREIIVMFYDEDTPTALYDYLAENSGNEMIIHSLHKWGYGTKPDAPRIEGAHNFAHVLAYPLPNDIKPLCYDITVVEDQSDVVDVQRLTEVIGKHGKPYLSAEGKVLFPVPEELLIHAQSNVPARKFSGFAAARAWKPAPQG